MTVVLGIDAAWTAAQPSGVAVVAKDDEHAAWHTVAVAPSYTSFLALAEGTAVDWTCRKSPGSTAPVKELLAAAESLAGAAVDLVALDMPVALEAFTGRRAADQAISGTFGGRGCSTHSPSETRPGPLGRELMGTLARLGYPLMTTAQADSPTYTIEVYPHPALLTLLGRDYRVPYKVGKSGKYWPGLDRPQRIARLLGEFVAMNSALEAALGGTGLRLPRPADVPSLAALKPYEDALDALVCAWVGCRHAEGKTAAYGNRSAAIWVPEAMPEPGPVQGSARSAC